jgi:16S rRNA U516 pseudouridylate synthase RsuA-like enzyme
LQKVLAVRGWGSRRLCEDMITAGRVTVNGEVAVLGRRVDTDNDLVEVDGVPIGVKPGLVYYLLNKPEGVVTTAHDPQGRPTVVEMVPDEPRVYPVGRLDVGTEGLLLLTNDGDLAHRLAHPSHGVEKEYLAEVAGWPARHRCGCGAARGRRAGGRHHRAGQGVAAQPGRPADHHPRGAQPAGAADVRGGRAPRAPAGSRANRAAARRTAGPRAVA